MSCGFVQESNILYNKFQAIISFAIKPGPLMCKALPAFHFVIVQVPYLGQEKGMEEHLQEEWAPRKFSLCGTIP